MHPGDNAILIATHQLSDRILWQYREIKSATEEFASTFILYHQTSDKIDPALASANSHIFENSILETLGYTPLGDGITPGNNHFSLLDFYLKNQAFKFYWYLEYDVLFNGNWLSFFNNFNKIKADFISTNIDRYENQPNWHWWPTLQCSSVNFTILPKLCSFNPIYRLSFSAISFLDQALKKDWCGHHETVIPTILYNNGFKILDIGGEGPFVSKTFKNRFYTKETFRWRPIFEQLGKKKNKLYHPIK